MLVSVFSLKKKRIIWKQNLPIFLWRCVNVVTNYKFFWFLSLYNNRNKKLIIHDVTVSLVWIFNTYNLQRLNKPFIVYFYMLFLFNPLRARCQVYLIWKHLSVLKRNHKCFKLKSDREGEATFTLDLPIYGRLKGSTKLVSFHICIGYLNLYISISFSGNPPL